MSRFKSSSEGLWKFVEEQEGAGLGLLRSQPNLLVEVVVEDEWGVEGRFAVDVVVRPKVVGRVNMFNAMS